MWNGQVSARSNGDLHLLIQGVQEFDEPRQRKLVDLAMYQRRDLWLIDAQNRGGLRLRQPPSLDDLTNAVREVRLVQGFLSVGQSQVLEDVAAAFLNHCGYFLCLFLLA